MVHGKLRTLNLVETITFQSWINYTSESPCRSKANLRAFPGMCKMTEITLEKYNELMEKYDALVLERDTIAKKLEDMTGEIDKRDEKIKNLNDALYSSIVSRHKPAEAEQSKEKTFDELLMEAFEKK